MRVRISPARVYLVATTKRWRLPGSPLPTSSSVWPLWCLLAVRSIRCEGAGPARRDRLGALPSCYARGVHRVMILGGLAIAAGLVVGCDASPATASGLVLATLDTHHFCDMSSIVEVRLQARWQACLEDEPGCEAPPRPEVDGDRYTCPASDARHELGVELERPGRYRFEALAIPTAGAPMAECFVDPDTGEAFVELPRARLSAASPLVLDEHGPCPDR